MSDDPQLDQLDAPPADDPQVDAETVNDGPDRFAVYDRDHLRFRGGVHDTRKAADDVKTELGKGKNARRGRYEVRKI